MDYQLLTGDCRTLLDTLPEASVQCVVTSPPYWGLRDYGTATWEGGDPACDHVERMARGDAGRLSTDNRPGNINPAPVDTPMHYRHTCGKCGARRIDAQLGMEPLHDCLGWATGQPCGACYVCHMVQVFRAVRRVLRDDGCLFLNLGDSYNGSGGAGGDYANGGLKDGQPKYPGRNLVGLKPKDLCMIPARVALALQADGWWLRQKITWCKKSAMPESVTDRPTSATEDIYLLTKSARYYYDNLGYAEPATVGYNGSTFTNGKTAAAREHLAPVGQGERIEDSTRNLRNFWLLGPEPYAEAHFATFPSEIPRRAILLGTSAHGQCARCGAPWRRVVEREANPSKHANTGQDMTNGAAKTGNPQTSNGLHRNGGGVYAQTSTTGWAPSCECGCTEVVPQTVLDPFAGSGTTLAVALSLGRRAVGIELSPAYTELAHKRITRAQPALFGIGA